MENCYLTPKTLPVSFTGQALIFGARSKFLNPVKEKKDLYTRYLANPLRALARLIYQIGVALLLTLPGISYHLYMTCQNENDEKTELKKRHHFEAAKQDFLSLISLGGLFTLRCSFASAPKQAENFFLGNVKIRGESGNTKLESFVFYVNSSLALRT